MPSGVAGLSTAWRRFRVIETLHATSLQATAAISFLSLAQRGNDPLLIKLELWIVGNSEEVKNRKISNRKISNVKLPAMATLDWLLLHLILDIFRFFGFSVYCLFVVENQLIKYPTIHNRR